MFPRELGQELQLLMEKWGSSWGCWGRSPPAHLRTSSSQGRNASLGSHWLCFMGPEQEQRWPPQDTHVFSPVPVSQLVQQGSLGPRWFTLAGVSKVSCSPSGPGMPTQPTL